MRDDGARLGVDFQHRLAARALHIPQAFTHSDIVAKWLKWSIDRKCASSAKKGPCAAPTYQRSRSRLFSASTARSPSTIKFRRDAFPPHAATLDYIVAAAAG